MARNFVREGNVIPITVSGGCVSGSLVVKNQTVGVAEKDASSGSIISCSVEGVFTLPKAAVAISEGARVYATGTSGSVTTSSTGNTACGVTIEAALSDTTTVKVKLCPGMVGP